MMVGVQGLPPFRQKKGERMGHGAIVVDVDFARQSRAVDKEQ
jgi:hypothetical protein